MPLPKLNGGCRQSVRDLLADVQSAVGLDIHFVELPSDHGVFAEYYFDPHSQTPTIRLRSIATDVDLAHELTHMQMELIDGFSVAAWKRGAEHFQAAERAFGLVRSYVDDQVVHHRLLNIGLNFDGEIIRPPYFDDLCTKVPIQLNKGAARAIDGMAHLDGIGYGHLRRATFLIQAELLNHYHVKDLTPAHAQRLTMFINSFRSWRQPESILADRVLKWFYGCDVNAVDGHADVLSHWLEFEGLFGYVGVSQYEKRGGKYLLPWPA